MLMPLCPLFNSGVMALKQIHCQTESVSFTVGKDANIKQTCLIK